MNDKLQKAIKEICKLVMDHKIDEIEIIPWWNWSRLQFDFILIDEEWRKKKEDQIEKFKKIADTFDAINKKSFNQSICHQQ